MNLVMPPAYDPQLVALSLLAATIGSFVALTASQRIVGAGGRVNLFNVAAAATALGGVGVWSMHFIGMLALRLEMGVSYSIYETAVSLLAAIALSAAALLYVARRRTGPRVLAGGLVLGAGVVLMHYLGMAGMRFGGYIEWSPQQVAASVAIALAAATAALWLAFRVSTLPARAFASLLMAAAVAAMHYTGMDAATFICTTSTPTLFPEGEGLVTSLQLPLLVGIAAFGTALMIFIDQVFQRVAAREASRAVARGDRRRFA